MNFVGEALISLVVASMLIGGRAYAEDKGCQPVAAGDGRISCSAPDGGLTLQFDPLKRATNWVAGLEVSDFTDATVVTLQADSQEAVECGQFGSAQPLVLFIRCQEDITALYIAGECHMASGFEGYGQVDIRFDDDAAFKVSMEESTDNSSLGLWNGVKSIPFIKKMIGHRRMRVRFTPFNESPTTASFQIFGLEDDIRLVQEACHWGS